MLLGLAATVALNVVLFRAIPKDFFPQQDTGRLIGVVSADQSISFQLIRRKLAQIVGIVQHDAAVAGVVGFTGGSGGGRSQTNTATVFVALKPLAQRSDDAAHVVARLRIALSQVPGATLFLVPAQDIQIGGRQSNAAYQFTLQADSTEALYAWTPRLTAALQADPRLTDVNSDQQQKGLQTNLEIDRDTAARLGITPAEIDNTLYDAFGQRQVSVIHGPLAQYHVVMEVAPRYWEDPAMLGQIWISTAGGTASGTQTTNALPGTVSTTASASGASASGATSAATSASAASVRNAATNAIANVGHGSASSGAAVSTAAETMVPLAALARYGPGNAPLSVNHQGPFVAATISFSLPPGRSLSDAVAAVEDATRRIGLPASIHGSFAGTARAFQQSLQNELLLVAGGGGHGLYRSGHSV